MVLKFYSINIERSMRNSIINLIALLAAVFVLYFNWTNWHQVIIGVVALILYYTVTTIAWGRVVETVLPLNKNWGRVFGFLGVREHLCLFLHGARPADPSRIGGR